VGKKKDKDIEMKKPAFTDKTGHECTIQIRVEPRSSRPGIAGAYGEGIKVRLASPPVEGKANRELIAILAKELKIKKSDIEILSGKTSKDKVVKISGVKDIREILGKDQI
jgi:uncharacterized protein (TIGR00251 family)